MFRRRGQDIHQDVCTEDLTEYHQNIDSVDQGNHFRENGAGFTSKAHFKKWYKCGNLGLCDFGLLNSQIAWNMSCEWIVAHGVQIWDTLKKWMLSAILDEEFMNFTDVVDSDNMTELHCAMPQII